MTDFQVEANKLSPDAYLELFDFDATGIGGSISYYTNSPTGGGVSPIAWRGNGYYPLPFELTGVDVRGDGTAASRPNIAISNVNKVLHAAILALGNLVGMKVVRWRTYYKFTDGQANANILMCMQDTWVITRKVAHSKQMIQFEMSSPLDRPGLKLPRKQILRDQGFPGVSRVRLR